MPAANQIYFCLSVECVIVSSRIGGVREDFLFITLSRFAHISQMEQVIREWIPAQRPNNPSFVWETFLSSLPFNVAITFTVVFFPNIKRSWRFEELSRESWDIVIVTKWLVVSFTFDISKVKLILSSNPYSIHISLQSSSCILAKIWLFNKWEYGNGLSIEATTHRTEKNILILWTIGC